MGPHEPMGRPKLRPIMGGAQVWVLRSQWGIQNWAHWRPKLEPIMGGAQEWALMGPWGPKLGLGSSLEPHGPMWSPNFDPSWAGLRFKPWGAQTWAHHKRASCLSPHEPMGLGPSWALVPNKPGCWMWMVDGRSIMGLDMYRYTQRDVYKKKNRFDSRQTRNNRKHNDFGPPPAGIRVARMLHGPKPPASLPSGRPRGYVIV
jgi:hypothetical protein